MTTIQASAPPIQTSGGGSGASGGNDIAAQISRILDKIQQLTQQLKELADSSGSADEKEKAAGAHSDPNHRATGAARRAAAPAG